MSAHGRPKGDDRRAQHEGTPANALPPLRVALVDDHAVVREGYRRLIETEPGIHVVADHGNAEDAYAALQRAPEGSLDVLVLDLSMPGLGGLDLLRRLLARWPGLRVLVFTMHDSPAMVAQCLRLGAAGFVTKSSAPDVLVDALRRVGRGEIALSPDVADAGAADAARGPQAAPPHARLSARELDVLHRLLAGHGVDDIAAAMKLSPKTVANYQTEIRQKLGVGNAVELLRYARLHGIEAG